MLYLKWNDKDEHNNAMKQMRTFKSKAELHAWYKKNHTKIKNVLIPIGSSVKRSDLKA